MSAPVSLEDDRRKSAFSAPIPGAVMDRSFPEPHPLDPDENSTPEPRPERDPDEAMRQRQERDSLDREEQRRADVRAADLYSRCHIEFLHNPRG